MYGQVNPHQFTNQTIFITGASSGIGRACAHIFAQGGAHLILCARRKQRLDELATELCHQYQCPTPYLSQCDVRNREHVHEETKKILEHHPQIHVLVNNAGLAAGLDPIQSGDMNDWDTMIDTNIKGVLYITRQILPAMVSHKNGHIINIGSISGHEIYPKGNVYVACKHAIEALTKAMRMDLMGHNIRVTSISPGLVNTEFSNVRFKGDQERADSVYKGMTPLTAENIADVTAYCVSCPPHVNLSNVVVMPTAQASASMVHRDE